MTALEFAAIVDECNSLIARCQIAARQCQREAQVLIARGKDQRRDPDGYLYEPQ